MEGLYRLSVQLGVVEISSPCGFRISSMRAFFLAWNWSWSISNDRSIG